MVAKKFAFAFCIFSFLQTSFAGLDRFWIFTKNTEVQEVESWDSMSPAEQEAVIKRYQSLNRELPPSMSESLQQRMDWFTQLPEAEQQRMREAWQKMSSQERRDLKQRLQKASPEERATIREEYITKYLAN